MRVGRPHVSPEGPLWSRTEGKRQAWPSFPSRDPEESESLNSIQPAGGREGAGVEAGGQNALYSIPQLTYNRNI